MFCSNCGKMLSDSANFCTACGKKVVNLNTNCDNNVMPSIGNDDNSQFAVQVAPTTNSNEYGRIKTILDPSRAQMFDFTKMPTSSFNAMDLKRGFWVSNDIDLHDYSDIKKLGFDIEALYESSVVLSKVQKTDKEIYTKIRKWSFVEQFQNGFVFIEPIYIGRKVSHDKSNVLYRDCDGVVKNDTQMEVYAHRFKSTNDCNLFVVCTYDKSISLYVDFNLFNEIDLSNIVDDKNHIRNVDISHDGKLLLYTYVDKAFLLDNQFRVIDSWQTVQKEGWEKRETKPSIGNSNDDHNRYLSILGLIGNESKLEIKKVFKKQLLSMHPDINKDDPNAKEKTQDIIQAYEWLMKESAENAFNNNEDSYYYCQLINRVKIDIEGTGGFITIEMEMIGPGEDWIYATHFGQTSGLIYLGCYSGKIYSVDKSGRVLKLYRCDAIVEAIYERLDCLFIQTNKFILILKNDEYLSSINISKSVKVRWFKNTFVLISKKDVVIYSYGGTVIGRLTFEKPIYDVFEVNMTINIVTSIRTYEFSLKAV